MGFLNRAMRRLARKKKAEVVIRSESILEVLENMLGRRLNHASAADMGILDEFTKLNKRLEGAPAQTKESVRQLWQQGIIKMREETP